MKLHDLFFGIAILISVLTAFTDAGYPCNYCRPAYSATQYYAAAVKPVVYPQTVQTFVTNIYPQAQALQGGTHYGMAEVNGNVLSSYDPQTLHAAQIAFWQKMHDDSKDGMAGTGLAIQATQASYAQVQGQAYQVKALEIQAERDKQTLQQLKVEPSTVTVTAGGSAQVAAPAQAEGVYVSRCLSCHSEASAAAKGGGSVLPGLTTLTREQKDLVLDRIHRHGSDRMPKGGSLTDDERRALEGALK